MVTSSDAADASTGKTYVVGKIDLFANDKNPLAAVATTASGDEWSYWVEYSVSDA